MYSVQSALICPHWSRSRCLLCSVSCELCQCTPHLVHVRERGLVSGVLWIWGRKHREQVLRGEGRGEERRGLRWQSWTLFHGRKWGSDQLSDTTSRQLRVMHRDNRAGMSRRETYLGEEPSWVEGGGTGGPVGTECGEGELQGTETMAEVN